MSDEQQYDSTTTSPLRARRKPIPLTPEKRREKQQIFLDAYGECGVIKYACRVAQINRSTVRYWLEHDKDFKDVFPDSKEDACDTLEFAAYTQAVEGTEEPAVSMGKLVYEEELVLDENGEQVYDSKGRPVTRRGNLVTIKKYSPQLLITLLKANMPEKYRERTQVEHSGPGGGPIQIQRNPNLKNLNDEELDALENLAKKAVGEGDSGDNS